MHSNFHQGITHTAVTPLDLVKCRRQVDSKMYTGNFQAWGKIARAEGFRGIYTGWSPTFFGYSAQGAFKYGGYEFFKKWYSDLAGAENAAKYKTSLYLTASASAEFIADIALCPFEAVKVRSQTTIPPFAKGTFEGISKITSTEGFGGLYKGLYPLWGRQIPYTMMKFASFETIVEMIYERMPGKKSDYGKGAQTAVSFTGGYLAGILCAIVSHPADVMVSFHSVTIGMAFPELSIHRCRNSTPIANLVKPSELLWAESTRTLDSLDCGMDCPSGL